jgi:hypothetical protein
MINKDPIAELPRAGQVYRSGDYPGFRTTPLLPTDCVSRQLIWSSHKANDWEILVYKHDENWEACFFRWPLHHEHASGPSFESVKGRAEQRILFLEARRLKGTNWVEV